MRRLVPAVLMNPVSLVGTAIAFASLLLIVFLFLVEAFSPQKHPYMGLLTYILLPMLLVFGLLLTAWGVYRVYRRARAHPETEAIPFHIDLSIPRHRNALAIFMAGTFLFLVISAFGSYQAYEYTDSVQFCGQLCHTVMKPEYTAYLASPHARVACVQCHIGPGADWFVRSKISGAYQVYSVIFHKYHRPIETPIANLRPARETCEQCHWPRQFYSAKLQGKTYFLSDDKNTPAQINMLLKIGGGDPAHGAAAGIHFHMYIASTMRYVARDRRRTDIPWIEARTADGKVTVYRSTENPMTDAQASKADKHIVDCIECHNRPTHIFHNPAQSINQAMALGWISPDLPGVKKLCVDTLEASYKSEAQAQAGIRRAIDDYYRAQYPQVHASRQADIEAAIRQTQKIYSLNYFPEMNVSWKGFPDHIGHMYSPGCFRCHDGKHRSDDGRVISRDCNICHTILSERVANGAQRVSLSGLPFQHPVDIGDAWKTSMCSDCHAAQ